MSLLQESLRWGHWKLACFQDCSPLPGTGPVEWRLVMPPRELQPNKQTKTPKPFPPTTSKLRTCSLSCLAPPFWTDNYEWEQIAIQGMRSSKTHSNAKNEKRASTTSIRGADDNRHGLETNRTFMVHDGSNEAAIRDQHHSTTPKRLATS